MKDLSSEPPSDTLRQAHVTAPHCGKQGFAVDGTCLAGNTRTCCCLATTRKSTGASRSTAKTSGSP